MKSIVAIGLSFSILILFALIVIREYKIDKMVTLIGVLPETTIVYKVTILRGEKSIIIENGKSYEIVRSYNKSIRKLQRKTISLLPWLPQGNLNAEPFAIIESSAGNFYWNIFEDEPIVRYLLSQ